MFKLKSPPKGNNVKVEPKTPNPTPDNSGEKIIDRNKRSGGITIPEPILKVERPLLTNAAPSQYFRAAYKSKKISLFTPQDILSIPLDPNLTKRKIYHDKQLALSGDGDWLLDMELVFLLNDNPVSVLPVSIGSLPGSSLSKESLVNWLPSTGNGFDLIYVAYAEPTSGTQDAVVLSPYYATVKADEAILRLKETDIGGTIALTDLNSFVAIYSEL